MPIIELKPATCKQCGKGKRIINIKFFNKEFTTLTESSVKLWKNRCCWVCKAKPEAGQVWGLSINHTEKNRLYCPKCASMVQDKLDNNNKTPYILEELKNGI